MLGCTSVPAGTALATLKFTWQVNEVWIEESKKIFLFAEVRSYFAIKLNGAGKRFYMVSVTLTLLLITGLSSCVIWHDPFRIKVLLLRVSVIVKNSQGTFQALDSLVRFWSYSVIFVPVLEFDISYL